MKLRFFVICYGDTYLDLLDRVAIRSLTQPQNRAAVPAGAIVSLYSDEASMDRAKAICERLAPVEAHLLDMKAENYDTQNGAFIAELERCVKADAGIVIVNPDVFWGDGSLGNLLAVAGEQNVAVAAAHPRVDSFNFFNEMLHGGFAGFEPNGQVAWLPVSNEELVTRSMRSLHQSWKDANVGTSSLSGVGTVVDKAADGRPDTGTANSYFTGIGIRQIADGTYAVHHLQPTVWYARPTARDYAYFAARPTARGVWDHFWPEILAQEQRLRTIASSDAFFVVELTDANTHNTELVPVDPKNPTKFHKDGPHIVMQRNVVHVWREG